MNERWFRGFTEPWFGLPAEPEGAKRRVWFGLPAEPEGATRLVLHDRERSIFEVHERNANVKHKCLTITYIMFKRD